MSLLYGLLAAFGLGFLIFIHEMGHFIVARLVGIEVEAFSIGFGRPIVKWDRKGVRWQIGWIPFGGYVRVKGIDKDGDREPHEVPGGFFAAKPIRRIQFALGGPVVNLVFALVAFSLLWASGGREKPFSEFTRRVGWVDPHSELFVQGLRPGDEITAYDGRPLQTSQDHLYAPLLAGDGGEVSGFHIDYRTDAKTPFHAEVAVYPHPQRADMGLSTYGVLSPAQYLLFAEPFLPGSPLEKSGIQAGDRLFWADGSLVFSSDQLIHLLNDGRALATVERDGARLLRRVPRVALGDLSLSYEQRADFSDWRYELDLMARTPDLLYFPYDLSQGNVVEGRIALIDSEMEADVFPEALYGAVDSPLKAGDRIIAVDGRPVAEPIDLLGNLQQRQSHLVVRRLGEVPPVASASKADATFDSTIDWSALQRIVASIGTGDPVAEAGNLVLLPPVEPVTLAQLADAAGADSQLAQALRDERKAIEGIADGERREQAQRLFEQQENATMLGAQFMDRQVTYNPTPLTLYSNVLSQSWLTLKSLFSGYLSPKMLSGPVGMVTIMHYSWAVGMKEGLFWLGVISLNLGVLNLLPIPVLDGGHIGFALYEMVTRRRIKAKTMERLVIPFVVLIIGFFIYVTYHDIVRLLF